MAKKVLEAYDLNGDAKLDAAEQQACLSLVAARERMDMNKDGNLTAGEISQRVEAYRSMSDFIATTIQVLRDSRPVPGICVTMTAETFLWKKSEVYTGVTDESGNVMVASPSGEMVGILPTGLYKVEFGDGDSVIRGCEIADDVPAANWLEFSF